MPRILVAPLDWGLGHATRCVPLIGELRDRGCEVILAADGATAKLLAQEFPDLELLPLKGYHIRYGRGNTTLALLLKLPRIFQAIRYERKWLMALLRKERFDCIISDNRPGLHHPDVYTIYITHQLLIRSEIGRWADRLLQLLHARYIRNFNKLWVPDVNSQPNLAGILSHPPQTNVSPIYIGLLSRLHPSATAVTCDLLILLSGPEPQRSVLEHQLLKQLQSYKGTVRLVRGLPRQEKLTVPAPTHVEIIHHLTATQLQKAMAGAKLVVCRSGYTTLMDLIRLQKKAVLIPTPGQTEQEYLARHLQRLKVFPFLSQKDFQLNKALELAIDFPFLNPFAADDFEQYPAAIDDLLAEISNDSLPIP
jgi:UDP-N-acetylglucosamine transferase subunit ALG13